MVDIMLVMYNNSELLYIYICVCVCVSIYLVMCVCVCILLLGCFMYRQIPIIM